MKKIVIDNIKVIGIAFELGFIIALPIVALGLIGKKIDQKFSTHFFVFIGIALAISLTTVWIYRRFEGMLETLRRASKGGDPAPKAASEKNGENAKKITGNNNDNFKNK